MTRDEALRKLREMARAEYNSEPRYPSVRWALDRIAYLEDIPRQIDGLAQGAETSGATERATLLLKLAAAEQRIAELESERDEARSNHVRVQKYLDQREEIWMQRVNALSARIAEKDAALAAHEKAWREVRAK